MTDDHADVVEMCCQQCGKERFELEHDEWGVELDLRDLQGIWLDTTHTMTFCSLSCFNEWRDNDPMILYEDESNDA